MIPPNASKENVRMLPFSNALELFFEMLLIERNASPHTLEGYRRDLLKLQKSLPKTSVNVDDVTADQCQHFFELLHQSGLSPLSRARCHSSLTQFFKFLMVEQYLTSNPMMMVARPRNSRHLPHALTLEEIDRLNYAAQSLVFPKNLQAVAILEILYASGMRISELLNLSRQEVFREGGVIVQGKGHRERVVPLHDGAYDAAWAYLQTLPAVEEKKKAYLFPSPRSPYRALTRQRCGQILKGLSVLAHIEPGRVYPHALRHAFATHLLEGGSDLLSVQKLLGHSSVNTTEIYTHLTQSHLTEALVSKHPLQKEARKKEER